MASSEDTWFCQRIDRQGSGLRDNIRAMRVALDYLAIAVLAACGGAQNASHSAAQPSAEEAQYPALHWAPDAPTYLVTAPRVRDAQRAIRDLVDSLGMVGRVTPEELGSAARELLGVDPLGDEVATKLGVDLDGGIAMFSESWSPTFVVHLAAPATTRAFFAHLRDLGMHSTAQTIDGIDVASAPLREGLVASWAIDGDWFWFHLASDDFGETEAPGAWLVHARHRTKPGWSDALAWAAGLARDAKPLVGFWNSHAVLAATMSRLHKHAAGDIDACIAQLETVERVGITVDGDGTHAAGKLAFDLGSAAPRIASAILPPPPGFAALAANAPLALQWNVDVAKAADALAPCLRVFGTEPHELAQTGVRSARVLLETFDPDGPSGTGAVALDLSSREKVGQLVDEIPRLAVQTDRSFGTYHGRHVAIPFVASLDYVLDDTIALAAMGDGLLDQLVAGTPPANAPLFAIDVRPPGLPERSWQYLLHEVFGSHGGKLVTSQLLKWRDGHIALTIDQNALVLDASGNRR
jgi:hypothetical protein